MQQSYPLEWKVDKVLPRQDKAKGVYHQQAIITGNVKGTLSKNKKIKLRTVNDNKLTTINN